MKKNKKLAVLLAFTMACSAMTQALAAVVAPQTEDFQSVEKMIMDTDWIGEDFGSIYVEGWRSGGFDYVGAAMASDVDSTRAEDDIALRVYDSESVDNGIGLYTDYVDLEKGDIYTVSFDFASAISGQSLRFSLESDSEGNRYYFGAETSSSEPAFGLGVDSFFELHGITGTDMPGYGTVMTTNDFVNYKVVVDTENEEFGGKQTIAYYYDNVQVGSTCLLKTIHDGVASDQPVSKIRAKIFPRDMLDCYFDNITYSVVNLDAPVEAVAEIESTLPTVENFQNVTQSAIENTSWIGNNFGSMYVEGWRDTGFDYVGISSAKTVDSTKPEDDMALYIQDPEVYDAGLSVQSGKAEISQGEIYTVSFDYAAADTNQTLRIKLCSDTENNRYYFGNISTPEDILCAGASSFFEYKGAANDGTYYYGPPIVANAFENYKIVIDTQNEAFDGKQTIAYYKNGAQMGKTCLLKKVKNGAASDEPITWAQIQIIPHNTLNCYIDNVTYSVTNPDSDNMAETFDGDVAYNRADHAGWSGGKKLGNFIELYHGDDLPEVSIAAASELDEKLADYGKLLKIDTDSNAQWGYDVMFNIPLNETLEKGDTYSFSMEYYSDAADAENKMFVFLNSNPMPNWIGTPGDGVEESQKYEFTSVMRSGASAVKSTQAILKKYNNSMYMCNDDGGAKWYNNDGMHRYDIILNTADAEYGYKQTIAFYYDGVLQDKGYFYELNADGTAKTTPMTSLSKIGIWLNSHADASFGFNNIWSLKTTNKVVADTQTYAAGKMNVSYERPVVYTASAKEKLIVAEYDGTGRLINVEMKAAPTNARAAKASFDVLGTGAGLKMFMWNGTTMAPISNVSTIGLAD